MEMLAGFAIAFAALEALAIIGLLRAADRERSRLLDRIMARNYAEFIYAQRPTGPVEQLTTDEAEAAWYAASGREREVS